MFLVGLAIAGSAVLAYVEAAPVSVTYNSGIGRESVYIGPMKSQPAGACGGFVAPIAGPGWTMQAWIGALTLEVSCVRISVVA